MSREDLVFFAIIIGGVALFVFPLAAAFSRARQKFGHSAINTPKKQEFPTKRYTDRYEILSAEGKRLLQNADSLAQQGEILRAAVLYEQLKYQRRAIDLLEKHGYIQQACEVLIRLNAPLRAAAISERNHKPMAAAHYHAMGNNYPRAAEIFQNLAIHDYKMINKAWENAALSDQSHIKLRVSSENMLIDEFVGCCQKYETWNELLLFMTDLEVARSCFQSLSEDVIKKFTENLTFNPQRIRIASSIILADIRPSFSNLALKRLASNHDWACKFWGLLRQEQRLLIFNNKLVSSADIQELSSHGYALLQNGDFRALQNCLKNKSLIEDILNLFVKYQGQENLKKVLKEIDSQDLPHANDFCRLIRMYNEKLPKAG